MLAYLRRNLKYALPGNWRAGAKAAYRRAFRSGVLFSADELGMASMLPAQKLDCILELVRPRSVLDVGCGTGKSLAYFRERGIEAIGIEASREAIRSSGPLACFIWHHDLRNPTDLGRDFDLLWCFEVAEHIHPQFVETFVDTLVRHSRVIAMSAAPPGQGGEGHFNEQPQTYWVAKFAQRNYCLHPDWTRAMQTIPEFYSRNMMVFISESGAA
jgi:SAM-dependent methyltransferase